MRYVLTSKDGVFYKKSIAPNDVELTQEQIEVSKAKFIAVRLPCILADGVFVSVEKAPELANEYFDHAPEAEPEPSEADDTAAMLVDHEYRLTLLELGLTE